MQGAIKENRERGGGQFRKFRFGKIQAFTTHKTSFSFSMPFWKLGHEKVWVSYDKFGEIAFPRTSCLICSRWAKKYLLALSGRTWVFFFSVELFAKLFSSKLIVYFDDFPRWGCDPRIIMNCASALRINVFRVFFFFICIKFKAYNLR